jgi:hypothetical protein
MAKVDVGGLLRNGDMLNVFVVFNLVLQCNL